MAYVENARQLKYRCVYEYMYKLNICIYDEKKETHKYHLAPYP